MWIFPFFFVLGARFTSFLFFYGFSFFFHMLNYSCTLVGSMCNYFFGFFWFLDARLTLFYFYYFFFSAQNYGCTQLWLHARRSRIATVARPSSACNYNYSCTPTSHAQLQLHARPFACSCTPQQPACNWGFFFFFSPWTRHQRAHATRFFGVIFF